MTIARATRRVCRQRGTGAGGRRLAGWVAPWLLLLAAVIALVPVPYVNWAPGATHDLLGQVDGKDAITITGLPTRHPSGK